MAILKGDVKLVKSTVMDDVSVGGGGPTANEVVDGASNAIFPDVSESDRAAGRVSARKVHVWVQSDDTDTYLGPNVIVAKPPNDPNVSITLMSTGDTFDRRSSAISRIEAYLFVGSNYPAFLMGNHIEGQQTLSLFQRTDELPPIGGSLALTKREGFSDEFVQYVRVTEAQAILRTFTDANGDFQRYELRLRISDPLRADFPGFDVTRVDPTKAQLAAATKASNVVVADAARYYGVVKLIEDAEINDFTVKASGIFTQLVPSAQIETPIGDARTNQLLAGVVSGGAAITRSVTLAFTTSQNLFIGGAIKPGTLSLSRGGVTLTDNGGRLMNGGLQVGLIDYENGILSLTSNEFGTESSDFSITYQPGGVPDAVTQSQGFEVKLETRASSYVRTIEPPPVPGTLSVAYMVASRWYVLRDDGSGALRGPEGYGSGTVNQNTGTVAVTFGALPDVGSEVIYQWVEPKAAGDANQLTLDNDGKLYFVMNTSGVSSSEKGAMAIPPGGLSLTWLHGGVTRTVTDDGAGNLVGYGTGTVDYADGVVRMSPTQLPARGTQINMAIAAATPIVEVDGVTMVAGAGNLGATNIEPGSVSLVVACQLKGVRAGGPVVDWGSVAAYRIVDDGEGGLDLVPYLGKRISMGTINYATGAFTLASSVNVPTDIAALMTAWDNIYLYEPGDFMYTLVN